MDDSVAASVVLLGLGGIVGGLALGFLAAFVIGKLGAARTAASWGMVLGLTLCVGSCGTATGRLGLWVHGQTTDSVATTGRLLEHRSRTIVQQRGALSERRQHMNVPRVEFTDAEGRRHEFDALGGSLVRHVPGDAVPVLYRTQRPDLAVVDDFQHLWAATWLVGGLTLIALGFLVRSVYELVQLHRAAGRPAAKPAPPKPRSRLAARLHAPMRGAGITMFGLGLLTVFIDPFDNIGRGMALGLAGIAVGMLCLAIASVTAPATQKRRVDPGGLLLVAAVLTIFAVLLWNAGAR